MEQTRKQILQGLLEVDPDDSFTRYALGLEHLAEGDAAGAVRVFQEVRSRDPGYLAVYYQLGKAWQAAGDAEQAREAWQQGLRVAESARDWHTHDELQAALDDLG